MIAKILSFLLLTFSLEAQIQPGFWQKEAQALIQEKGNELKIGIISAKPQEQGNLLSHMESVVQTEHGKRTFYEGELFGLDTVLTLSKVGKVASSITTTELISRYHADLIIFIGTAGAIDECLKRGDVVIGKSLVQHDLDASPFVPPFVIPLLRVGEFYPDPFLKSLTTTCAKQFLSTELQNEISNETLRRLNVLNPNVYEGLIASGDIFVSSIEKKRELKMKLPELLCVEMEGAAVAHVAFEYNIPCLIIRIISDEAGPSAYDDFLDFLETIAPVYSHGILKMVYEEIKKECPQSERIGFACTR